MATLSLQIFPDFSSFSHLQLSVRLSMPNKEVFLNFTCLITRCHLILLEIYVLNILHTYIFLFIGRSKIVGTPMAELLKWAHATVTTCHSRTKGVRLLNNRCRKRVEKRLFIRILASKPEVFQIYFCSSQLKKWNLNLSWRCNLPEQIPEQKG